MVISDFARLGQVSVPMLRHYDASGLLVPDHVDPASGSRSCSPEQLHLLDRLVALKDLGSTDRAASSACAPSPTTRPTGSPGSSNRDALTSGPSPPSRVLGVGAVADSRP